ncbi:MAG: TetR family transcriptional regulator [Bryobacterales bacterium]|nr:TetR family transcriptional regulator [Bryobacterales bacterium]
MNQAFDTDEAPIRVTETKDRILDSAEKLFSEHGFAATSLRQITTEAAVNLAAVNYHFQSKESLILAVLLRKLEPINQRRLELLDEVEAEAGDDPLSLEAVLGAFLLPVLEAKDSRVQLCNFPRLMGRMYTEPGDWMLRIFPQAFAPVLARFQPAFRRAMPGAEIEEIGWGMHFSIGAMAHYLAGGALLKTVTMGMADPSDTAAALPRLVAYMAGGLRAITGQKEISQ